MSKQQWADDQIDNFLDLVLRAEDEMDFNRKLLRFGRDYGRDSSISLVEGKKMLQRRVIRRSDYSPSETRLSLRLSRSGLPWTWCERKCLEWAKNPTKESQREITAEYLAGIFNRTVEEVECELNSRHGVRGFDV